MRRVAAVDCGTNSTRLLVAEADTPLTTLARRMRITRLGQGVDATGHLDDGALARTLDCLAGYADEWRALGAERVRIAATSAVRDAADRERFFSGVREVTGVEAEVLSGDEEGRTAFLGATRMLDAGRPVCVVDIGGGSTEFIVGEAEPDVMTSRQLGCVRLAEGALGAEPPSAEARRRALAVIDAELDATAELADPGRAQTLVAVAGTATTLAALHLGLDAYEPERIHATRVPAEDLQRLTERLLGMTVAERGRLAAMAPGREDVIHAGALILSRVAERFGFPEVLVSEADILDGLVLDLLAR